SEPEGRAPRVARPLYPPVGGPQLGVFPGRSPPASLLRDVEVEAPFEAASPRTKFDIASGRAELPYAVHGPLIQRPERRAKGWPRCIPARGFDEDDATLRPRPVPGRAAAREHVDR